MGSEERFLGFNYSCDQQNTAKSVNNSRGHQRQEGDSGDEVNWTQRSDYLK